MGKSFRTATERQHSAWVERARARRLSAQDYSGAIATHHGDRMVPNAAPRAYTVADLQAAVKRETGR